MVVSNPSLINSFANRSLNVAIPPPRRGYAGPIIMIFLEFKVESSLFKVGGWSLISAKKY